MKLRSTLVGALLLAVIAVPGCARGQGEAGCALVIVWSGRTYTALGFHLTKEHLTYADVREPRVGRRLGTGRVPACEDEDSDPTKIGVYAVVGVDPSAAVVSKIGTLVIEQDSAIPTMLLKPR
jgi:Family of unknown function (DUF6281)